MLEDPVCYLRRIGTGGLPAGNEGAHRPLTRHAVRDITEGDGSIPARGLGVVEGHVGLAQELGIDNIHSFISRFGFGSKTGIDIDGEATGLMAALSY